MTPVRASLGERLPFVTLTEAIPPRRPNADLRLCWEITRPGGLIALDDYFNPSFPGVCEGAITFFKSHPGTLIPIAVGFNKVLFQKAPAALDVTWSLHACFRRSATRSSHFGSNQQASSGPETRTTNVAEPPSTTVYETGCWPVCGDRRPVHRIL